MPSTVQEPVSASNEWSKLRSVIVGRADKSCFPSEPAHMIRATMPDEHQHLFKSQPDAVNPFPEELVARANRELDNLAEVLEKHGVTVHRPEAVDFQKISGYTAAMPRDGLMSVGNTLIEACFAWRCRRFEIELGFSQIIKTLEASNAKVVRAPLLLNDSIYDGKTDVESETNGHAGEHNGHGITNGHENGQKAHAWAINNSRPAFDCADFMRFGKVLIGQLSNVTNMAGVEYVRAAVPAGYSVELLETNDPHAMHIDATILPLRQGLLAYNPERVSEDELRRHALFKDWKLLAYPYTPKNVGDTPLFMTSAWIALNVLSLDDNTIIAEEHEQEFIEWTRGLGYTVVTVPFRAVNSMGGSLHCATVDLVRE